MPEALTEPDRGGRLARPEWSRRDCADDDILGPRTVTELIDRVEGDLRCRTSVWFQQVWTDAHVGCNLFKWTTGRSARNSEIRRHGRGA